jgi:hypothetical protein
MLLINEEFMSFVFIEFEIKQNNFERRNGQLSTYDFSTHSLKEDFGKIFPKFIWIIPPLSLLNL